MAGVIVQSVGLQQAVEVAGCFLAMSPGRIETRHFGKRPERCALLRSGLEVAGAKASPHPNLAYVNEGKDVYDQDHAVLEAQQAAIDKNPRQPFHNLNIDAGALWARRMIDRMLAAEQGERCGRPAPVWR
jgi:hypothetical protein